MPTAVSCSVCVCVCSPPGDWLRTVWVDYPGAPGTKAPSRRWGGAGCDPHSHLPSPLAHTWCSPCLEGGLWVEASQALWNLGAEQGPLLGLKVALTLWPSFHPSFLPLTCPYFPLASSSDSFTLWVPAPPSLPGLRRIIGQVLAAC